jgi:hypothetical protein
LPTNHQHKHSFYAFHPTARKPMAAEGKYWRRMEVLLKAKDLQLVDVPSHGSCFFIALANRLFGSPIAEPDPMSKSLDMPTVLRILCALHLSDRANVLKCDSLASHGISHADNIGQELAFAMKSSKTSGFVKRTASWAEYLEIFSQTGALIAETFQMASLTILFDLRLLVYTCFDPKAKSLAQTLYEPPRDKQFLITLNKLLAPFGIGVEPTGVVSGGNTVTLARSQTHFQIVCGHDPKPVPCFTVLTLRQYSKCSSLYLQMNSHFAMLYCCATLLCSTQFIYTMQHRSN